MNVAMMTWYHFRNYGTALQAAALSEKLRDLGCEPHMIRYIPGTYFPVLQEYSLKAIGKRALKKALRRKYSHGHKEYLTPGKKQRFAEFLESNLQFTEECRTTADLERLNGQFQAFICGSDQIWSPLCFNPKYFLDFVKDPAKKIAYAPSLGVGKVEDRYIKSEIARLLCDIDHLSVREETGRRFIEKCTGRNCTVALDPTLLLPAGEWIERFSLHEAKPDDPYLLVYMLGNDPEHWKAAQQTAEHLGLSMRIIPVFSQDAKRKDCIKEPIGPKEFAELILNAEYICTDSYHGLAFSILFHRPFTAFPRFQKSDPKNQNARVFHLLSVTSLQDRLANQQAPLEIADTFPSFVKADEAISKMRELSVRYLSDALRAAGETKTEPRHVMKYNSLCCGCGACVNECSVNAISIELNGNGFLTAKVDEGKCIGCEKCIHVCPFCTPTESRQGAEATLYSFKSARQDVLLRSSSGGAAFELSRILLRENYTIAGCRFNTDRQIAEHILIRNEEELSQLQGSKYIQSHFSDALKDLCACKGPIAVFGTPCQIAAVRRVMSNRNDVLYFDLVCHGVPTAHLFKRYRDHISRTTGMDTKQASMCFRYKPKGWRQITLYANDGTHEYCCDQNSDLFFRMFEVGNCYNEACYECRWRLDSEADIRLADYWGPRFAEDSTGVSMLVCYTDAGSALVKRLASQAGEVKSQPIEDLLKYQQIRNHPKPYFYDAIIQDLKNEATDFPTLVDRYTAPYNSSALSFSVRLKKIGAMVLYEKKR